MPIIFGTMEVPARPKLCCRNRGAAGKEAAKAWLNVHAPAPEEVRSTKCQGSHGGPHHGHSPARKAQIPRLLGLNDMKPQGFQALRPNFGGTLDVAA